MTKIGRQLICSLTIIALIWPSFARGQILPSLIPPASSQKTPAQRLAESRKDDRRQCEAEVQSGTPSFGQAVAGAVTKPLKDAIKEETGKAMPASVNDALANRIPAAIETGVKEEVPNIITEGLKKELPLTLGEQIRAEMARNNETFDEFKNDPNFQGRFTGLVRASIDEVLPGVIRDGLNDRLPNIIDESIRVEIPNSLRLEFNKAAKPTIENHFRAQIDSLIGKIPTMVVDEVQNLQATIEGTISGLKAAMQSLAKGSPFDLALNAFALVTTFVTTGDWNAALDSIPEIAQMRALIENLGAQIKATGDFIKWAEELIANKDLLVQNLVDGFALELSQSLTDPKNIAQLADAIGSAMTDPINRSLDNAVEKIEASIEGPINDAINGINGLPDKLFAPIDAALDDISGLVSLEIETVVHAVTNPIVSTIDVVGNNIAREIDGALEGVLSPIINDTGAFLGSVGNSIAFDMRVAATEAHIAIFGSEGLFVDLDSTGGQPLWPNGVTGLPQPPSYFPGPGEAGFEGPIIPFTEVGPPNEAIGEVTPALDLAPVGPLTEATESFSTGAADATISSAETVTGDAIVKTGEAGGLSALSGMASGLVPTMGASIAGAVTGLLQTGNPIADAAISLAVKKAVEMVSTAVFGAAGAVIAVPVTEIGALLAVNQSTDQTTSKILQTSEQIKVMTEKIYSLQVQACTYLKVAQRVQLALEEKELLNDPSARKATAKTLYDAQVEFVNDFLNQGRQLSDGMTGVATDGTAKNKGPLIIRNLNDHIAEAGREANFVFQDDLKRLETDEENHPNLKIIRESLETQDKQDPLRGTLTKTQIDKFRDDPQSLDNQTWWNTFTELGRPENNIYGQMLITQGLRDERVAAAQAAAAAEYEAGGGYAGTRECVATTADGKYCAKWQTLTPGSTIGGYSDRLAQAAIEQAAASDESIEDSIKSEVPLSAKRVENLSNFSDQTAKFSDTAKQSVLTQSDPCPGPGPCSGTGWPKPAARPILPTLPASPAGGLTLPLIPPILTAAFDIKQMPTTADLAASGVKNETIIAWAAGQAEVCRAKNDWPTGRVGNNAKTAGQSIGASGSATIVHPVNYQTAPVFSRIISAENLVGPILVKTELASNQLKYRTIFNPANAGGIRPDDVYGLTVYANGTPFTLNVGGPGLANPPTAAQVVKLFRDQITVAQEENSPLGRELRKYVFSYTISEGDDSGFLVMSPSLTYQLTCSKGEQKIDKEITISRL